MPLQITSLTRLLGGSMPGAKTFWRSLWRLLMARCNCTGQHNFMMVGDVLAAAMKDMQKCRSVQHCPAQVPRGTDSRQRWSGQLVGAALGRHTLVRGGQGTDRAPRRCMPTSSSAQSPALSRRASACPWAGAGDALEGQARLWQPSAGHKWTQVTVYTTAVQQQHPTRSPKC